MGVNFNHSTNIHSTEGARAALEILFRQSRPASMLDVGCGCGTWLKAAMELGVTSVQGVDGVPIPEEQLLIPRHCFRVQDLTQPWDSPAQFDLVICVEVAEHLPPDSSPDLIKMLAARGNRILFSAAAPGQPGQNHIHCQWPDFWQAHFNRFGFACDDSIRWQLWDNEDVEPWYRQNLFLAVRAPSAGTEARIKKVYHPAMIPLLKAQEASQTLERLRHGSMSLDWYVRTGIKGIASRILGRKHR